MHYLFKICMFISSFLPLYLLFLIINAPILYRIAFGNYITTDIIFSVFFFVLILLSVITALIIYFISKTNSNTFVFDTIDRPGDSVISYIFTYIVPLLSVKIDEFNTIIANIALVTFMCMLYIKLDLLYINPTLAFSGFISYKTNNGILLSDIPFSRLLNEKEVNGYLICNGVFIASQKCNDL